MNKLGHFKKLVSRNQKNNVVKKKDRGKPLVNKGLTKLHEDIINAIETLNIPLFFDLGCTSIINLNF